MMNSPSNKKRPTPAINKLCQKPLPVRAHQRPRSPKKILQLPWKKTRKQRALLKKENGLPVLTMLRSQLKETNKNLEVLSTRAKEVSANGLTKPEKSCLPSERRSKETRHWP